MRRQDWQQRFAQFGHSRMRAPFAWGTNDCCLFAADAVLAMTGEDPAAAHRGSYSSLRESQKLLQSLGGLRQLATSIFGNELAPIMAAVGDVVLVRNEGRELLAICNGTTVVAPGEHGLVVLGMDSAIAAWRI